MILEQYLYDEKAYCLKEQYDGTDCSDIMVPITPLPLFQIFPIIILKPVSKSFLETPLKLITTVLQLLTTDIGRNLEFLHSRRTDTHWRTKKHGSSCHRHDNPVRNIRNKLSQSSYLLHSLNNMLNSISRLEATVINLHALSRLHVCPIRVIRVIRVHPFFHLP